MYMGMRPHNYGYPEDFAKTEAGKELIASMRKKWSTEELPKFLKYFADKIDKNGGKWLIAGDYPTIADCQLVATLRNFTRGHVDHVDVKCLECNPTIVAYVKRFCALEEIKGRYTNGLGSSAY
jgi:glutathione S-transferase